MAYYLNTVTKTRLAKLQELSLFGVLLTIPLFRFGSAILGTQSVNQTEKELRVVGYRVDNVNYWVATGRYDLQTPMEHRDLVCLVETAS